MSNTFTIDGNIASSGSSTFDGDQIITGSLETTAGITASIFKGDGSTITSLNGTNISSGTIAAARIATLNQDTTGTAAKATILESSRTINGVGFDGSTDITTVEGNTSGTGAGGTLNMITIGTTEYSVATGTGNGNVETSGTPLDNNYAKFTSGYQIEGRSFTEVRTDLNIEDGADVTPSWVPSVNPNYLTSVGTINLTSGVTGILPVTNGGTGVNTVTEGRILIGNGTSALTNTTDFTYNTSNKLLSAPTASFAHLIVSQVISSSVINTSGSNIFGDESTDTQTLNGSVVLGNIDAATETNALFINSSNQVKKRALLANAFTSTTIPVIASTSVTDLSDVTSAGSGIIITAEERTTIGTNTSGISSNTSAISGKAASGANSDITSLSGLTTALSVAQGGTGQDGYTAGRILIGNGSSAFATDSGFTYASNILSIENMLKMSGETIISKSNAIFTIGDTDGNDGVEQIDFRVMGTNPLSVLDGEVSMTIGSLNTEETSVMINNSGQVGTRELGSNAFTSTTIPVIANTSVTDLNDVTSAGSGIIITGAERTAIGTNSGKTSFPGFGTTSATALVGNTPLLQIGTTSGTALAGNTPLLQIGTTATTALAGNTTVGTVVTGNGGGSGDTLSQINIGGTTFTVATGTGNGTVDTSGTPVDNDYAKFTDGNTIEGRSISEVKTDLSLNNVDNKSSSTIRGEITSANIPNNAADTSGNAATATEASLAANSTLAGGLVIGTGVNNSANQIVRTNSNGYADFGWINTTSGNTTSTITDVYVNTNDGYIRKANQSHFKSQLGITANTTAISGKAASGANTDITSIINSSLKVGQSVEELQENYINFADDKIVLTQGFNLVVHAGAEFRPGATNSITLGTSDYMWADAYSRQFISDASTTSTPAFVVDKDETNTGFYYKGTNQLAVTVGGNEIGYFNASGLQVTKTSATSQFSGHLQAHCLGIGTSPSTTSGEIRAAGDVVANYSSDKRLKKNIKPISSALDKLLQISGVTFDWIEKEEIHSHKGHDVGVIAQEVEAVLPEVVVTRDNGYKAVNYEKIVPLLIESIKDLKAEIDELKKSK